MVSILASTALTLTDVSMEAVDGFSPLKGVLGAIPTVYANVEVRSRALAQILL